jgi:hypothetical protein
MEMWSLEQLRFPMITVAGRRPGNLMTLVIMEVPPVGHGAPNPEGDATPQPFMILKDSPEGVWKVLQDHGSTGGGTAGFP